eukprot:6274849-Amphidinium_carterae.1
MPTDFTTPQNRAVEIGTSLGKTLNTSSSYVVVIVRLGGVCPRATFLLGHSLQFLHDTVEDYR